MKRAALLLLGLSAMSLTPLASPTPAASQAAESPAAVPAVELRYAAEGTAPEKVLVGDAIKLAPTDASRFGDAPKLEAITGEKSLYDQGWLAKIERTASGDFLITLTPTRPGGTSTPEIAVRDKDGKWVARLLPFQIRVESSIAKDDPKPEEPNPAYPPQSAPFPWLWAVILGVLATALISAIAYFVVRRLRSRAPKPTKPMPQAPPQPEDIRALEALARLDAQALPEKGEFKKHYFAASEILKAYLGGRFKFDALESTSAELVATLQGIPEFTAERSVKLNGLLSRMDIVKFTDEKPTVADAKSVVSQIRELIAATRRPPVEAGDAK